MDIIDIVTDVFPFFFPSVKFYWKEDRIKAEFHSVDSEHT